MKNAEIARLLEKAAVLMELTDENPFKVRAIEKSARAIRGADFEVFTTIQTGQKWSLDGVGKSIAGYLDEIVQTGTFALLEELKRQVPDGILELSRLPGLGAKKLQQLWHGAGILNVEALLQACESNQLAQLKGFGAKSQIQLYNAALYFQTQRSQFRLDEATNLGQSLVKAIVSIWPDIEALSVGASARADVTADEVAVLINKQLDAQEQAELKAKLLELLDLQYVRSGTNSHYYETLDARTVVVHCTEADKFESDSIFLTADSETFSWVQSHPNEQVNQLPQYLWRKPILENLSTKRLIVSDIVTESDVRGVIHAHSTYSDGLATLEQMAEACKKLGYSYLGISDHSRTAIYANGLSIDRCQEQWAEIEVLNTKLAPFRIFKGIESDILADGSLDYPDEILAQFDFVIASVHSGLRMDKATATQRLIRAISLPATTILGHPTGRLLLRRQGYEIDHQAVIQACADHGVAIEINANPYRLDLDPQWIDYAQSLGVQISINPDAHSVEGISDIRWGVLAAQAGGLRKSLTLNALDADTFSLYLQNKK